MATIKIPNKYRILVIFILLVGTLLLIFNIPLYSVLSIEQEDTGKVLAFGNRKQMENFEIHYIHSIHKTPVLESYEIQGHKIVQQQIMYEQFAVGMPSNVEGEGKFIERNGHYIITDMGREFPYLDIRIAQVMPEHGIIIHNQLILFASFAKPGSWIRMKERKISMWQMMKGVDILEQTKSN